MEHATESIAIVPYDFSQQPDHMHPEAVTTEPPPCTHFTPTKSLELVLDVLQPFSFITAYLSSSSVA